MNQTKLQKSIKTIILPKTIITHSIKNSQAQRQNQQGKKENNEEASNQLNHC